MVQVVEAGAGVAGPSGLRRMVERVGRPPGALFHTMVGVFVVGVLAVAAWTGYRFLGLWAALLVAMAIGALWSAKFVTYCALRLSGTRVGGGARFAVVPLLMVGTALMVSFDLPQRALFEPSRDRMTTAADRLLAGGDPHSFPDRLGPHTVLTVEVDDHGVVFFTPTDSFVTTRAGFAYYPSSELPLGPDADQFDVVDLGGGWYVFSYTLG